MIDQNNPILTDLSHELLCHIFQYLPLQEVLSISLLCKKLLAAVNMHLRLCKSIDFCVGKIYGFMPSSITDDHMHYLFDKCPNLETVYGLHPLKVERRRLRKRSSLTVPGIIEALSLCHNLKSVETSDLRLLEAIMQHLPQLKIIGHFQNRDGVFPPQASQRLKLLPYPRISSLHLTGVEVPELTAMPHLEHLHLQCVRFTKLQPFRAFLATKLKTFVMKHCMGPSLSLRYLSLIIALSSSPNLARLELVRVPLPGGLFQRAVEDSYRHNGFVNLQTLVIAGCKGVLEADLGHLMIVASKNLERVFIQPSLTRDSLFVSLSFAQCEFPKLKDIHLGYVDKLDFSGAWSNDNLVSLGLAEVPDTPSSLTDSGMKVISELFPHVKRMSVSNCPHLMMMDQWSVHVNDDLQGWKELADLTLQRCHCLQLTSFALFLAYLPKIEVVILNDMFREPPKGCSHVGLSAGTGLGMSSAVVSNQDEHIAVQGHQQDFELQADDNMENEEMDRDFRDVMDNDENPDQHIMVLQQEFFDEENHVAPAAVMQRENVDPENRIENMEQEVPENRIRRELNEDYDGEVNENNSDDNGYDPKYMLFDEFVSSSDDEDDHSKTSNSLNETKPLKVSRKVGTDSFDFQVTDAINNGSCSESSKHPSAQHNSSCALPNEKMNMSFGADEVSNNLIDGESQDKSSVSENSKSYVKKCAHSKICTNKCSKGFDPSQPSTSRDGNCLDCSCADSDSEGKEDNNVRGGLRSHGLHNNNNNHKNILSIVSSARKKIIKRSQLPDEIFEGPLTRNRKKLFHWNIKKESTISESPKVSTVKRDEVLNTHNENPLENGHHVSSKSEVATANFPIKTEPPDNENDFIENPSNNQNVSKRDLCRYPSEENVSDAHDKPRTKKHKSSHDGYDSVENPSSNQNVSKRDEHINPSEENINNAYNKQKVKKHRNIVSNAHDKQKAKKHRNSSEENGNNAHDKQKKKKHKMPVDGYDLIEKSSKNQNVSKKHRHRNHSEEKVNNTHDKQKVKKYRNSSEENVSKAHDKQKARKHRNLSEENGNNVHDKQKAKKHRNSSVENGNNAHDKQKAKKHRNSSEENERNALDKQKTKKHRNSSEENVSNVHDKLKAKKHKKHKHKKSKKSSKRSRLSRKKGPITRSRTFRYLNDGHFVICQGTQATSADIRRSLRKQRNCSLRCKKKGNSICGSSHRKSHNHISARQQMKRPKKSNPNVEVQNKSTSTSDPLMEDDAVQTLRIVSETLISLTIISCGISDIFMDHCPNLSHMEVQACRILKMLQSCYCPSLKRFNVSQCPKLSLDVIATEVLPFLPGSEILISFEPCMQVYYPPDSEKIIFSKASLDQSVILFHDFTSPINEAVQATAKENLLRWAEIVQKIYYSPTYLDFYKHWLLKERRKSKKRVRILYNRSRYPFGHSLRRIHGISPVLPLTDSDCLKDGRYQILTNDHIFTSVLENKSWDKGFPIPETYEDHSEDKDLLSLMETEYTLRKLKMRSNVVSFYIPVIDSN